MTLSWTDAIAMEPYSDIGSYQEPAGFDVDFFSPEQKSSFSWSDMNDAGLLDKDNFLSQYSNPFKGIATNSGSGSGSGSMLENADEGGIEKITDGLYLYNPAGKFAANYVNQMQGGASAGKPSTGDKVKSAAINAAMGFATGGPVGAGIGIVKSLFG